MRNQDFEKAPNVDGERGRKRKKEIKVPQGFFYKLTPQLQDSLVTFSRKHAESARADGRLALKAHDKEKLERREERVISLLNAAVDHYAYALELFDACDGRRSAPRANTTYNGQC